MGSWHEVGAEIKEAGSAYDVIRRKYLRKLYNRTKRNIIIYYSGWLQKPDMPGLQVNDADKNGFMTVIHRMDRSKGLDLILHTPGGEAAATESLVDYLRSMFGTNLRAIVPQLALSAGTMIACACKEIIMGKQSSLGPIDPQFGKLPAHGVVEEFNRAIKEIKQDNARIPVWQPIIAKYTPAMIGECEKAIQWANEMAKTWLMTGMFSEEEYLGRAESCADTVLKEFADHSLTKSHARHLSAEKCQSIGLNVSLLEKDPILQDAVLTVHHAAIHTLGATAAFKIIENHLGVAFIQVAQLMAVPGPPRMEIAPSEPSQMRS